VKGCRRYAGRHAQEKLVQASAASAKAGEEARPTNGTTGMTAAIPRSEARKAPSGFPEVVIRSASQPPQRMPAHPEVSRITP
jgi:hypothetical protein